MGMVERVARELYRMRCGEEERPWSLLAKAKKTPYLENACTILFVLTEPTDSMIRAGIDAWEKSPMAVVTQFRAMIDKAIQESGE